MNNTCQKEKQIELETKRIDEKFRDIIDNFNNKFKDVDVKYQIQFTAAEKAIGIASTAQEKLVAQALDGTKEAINKADVATDKRFELLSEKITEVSDKLNLNAGAQGIYVTHNDLQTSLDKLQTNIESSLKPLMTFMNNSTGQRQGAVTSWQTVVSIISGVGALIAIFYALTK